MLLTNPIWLLALAAISIPVIIHLWNIKPGKTLKVGSIALFSESSPSSSRSFKLLDLLLLLLRCLLLTLLAFLLTIPLWQQHLKTSKAKGWVLIPPADFTSIYHKFQPKIDSLAKAGYEVHYFGPDFLKQDIKELAISKADTTKKKDSLNYWSLVNKLSGKIPAATPIELFTSNTNSHFSGEKPVTALNINWHTYAAADSVTTWLAGAWFTVNGSIRVMQGTSTPSGTTYQYNDIKNGGQNQAYAITIDKGQPFVSLKDSKIAVDTAITRIAIYTDKTEADANYLKAALQAITQLTGHNTSIKLYNQADAITANQDWIYWLSEKPVANSVAAKTKNLFSYEVGKINEVNSWLSNNQSHTITQGETKIALYKSIAAKTLTDKPVWTDGFGNALLSAEQKDKLTTYHFYSRFNPGWTELVWNDEFPKWLLALTQPANGDAAIPDRRILSDTQIKPGVITDTEKTPSKTNTYTDLTHYVWLALALVFFAERWLATKNKTILANG